MQFITDWPSLVFACYGACFVVGSICITGNHCDSVRIDEVVKQEQAKALWYGLTFYALAPVTLVNALVGTIYLAASRVFPSCVPVMTLTVGLSLIATVAFAAISTAKKVRQNTEELTATATN